MFQTAYLFPGATTPRMKAKQQAGSGFTIGARDLEFSHDCEDIVLFLKNVCEGS